jgi:transcriptional regulator with XRE-family HTH domain
MFALQVLAEPASVGKHIKCDATGYHGWMGDSDEVTDSGTGHSRAMRLILKQARADRDLSARELGEMIRRRLVATGDADAEAPAPSTIYAWEAFKRHPSIASYAAWARVLGYRLIVELDGADQQRKPVLVRTGEAAAAARLIDAMPEEKRRALLAMIKTM